MCFFKKAFKFYKKAFFNAFVSFFVLFFAFGKSRTPQNDTLGKSTQTGKLWSCDCIWLSNYVTGFWEDNPKNNFLTLVTHFVYHISPFDFGKYLSQFERITKNKLVKRIWGCKTHPKWSFQKLWWMFCKFWVILTPKIFIKIASEFSKIFH